MKKLKNEFSYKKYWIFDKNKSITISLFPNIELNRDNYNSFYLYEIFIYWLWFGIEFKYQYFKKLK